MPDKGRFKPAFVRHFFNFDIWKQDPFVKCSAVKHLPDQHAKTGLRAKRRFLRFARKRQPPVTGKSAKKGTLSVNLDEILAELVEQHCISKKMVFSRAKIKEIPNEFNRKSTAFVRYFI